MECEILKRSLKDSAAHSKLKLLKEGETFGVEKPGGEKRIHIGAITEEKRWDKFFFPNGNNTVNVIVSKIDLIKYLIEAKNEYLNPQQSYRLNISELYNDLYRQTLDINDESFQISFEKNVDKKRYYLTRPTQNPLSKNYKFIIDICLPILTNFVFLRIKNNSSYTFYLKLEFNPDIVTPVSNMNSSISEDTLQKIFYGSPGSGKSHTIRRRYEQDPSKVVRTTFHPDTDYATFVGCYKPITYEKDKEKKISYEFVPQAFTEAYIKAWNDLENPYILIIEEINRGNCAQIFGDLFQLLDRKEDGMSDYPINADTDLKDYLLYAKNDDGTNVLENKQGIKDGKLCLPPNLSIIASMNTSDQSLFPMDSAFKRRWAWEYVPIDYANVESGKFTITIGNKAYLWHDFLRIINDKIKKVTSSEDKQMGNFFIKHSIDEKEFKDKVLFYLWSEVGKDNYQTNDALFHCYKPGTKDKIEFSFNELYASDNIQKLQDFMDILGEEAKSKNYSWIVEEKGAATSNDEDSIGSEEELGK